MRDSTALIAGLRLIAATAAIGGACGAADTTRHEPDDGDPAAWFRDGLPRAKVHELHAAEPQDAATAAGFGVAMALAGGATPLLWLRTEAAERAGGRLRASGLLELGLDPAQLVLAIVADEAALLRAAADAARCPGLGGLVVEAWGRAPGLDLTATRRLQLAAEASGVTVMVLRVAGAPAPSAAATRWSVAACPSTALDAEAPGRPAFLIDLQRRRGGPAGQRWRVEWNRDTLEFDAEALSGAGLSLAADRAAAVDPPASVRRAG